MREELRNAVIRVLGDCKPRSFEEIRDTILGGKRGRLLAREVLAELVRKGVVLRIPAYERGRMEFILSRCYEGEKAG